MVPLYHSRGIHLRALVVCQAGYSVSCHQIGDTETEQQVDIKAIVLFNSANARIKAALKLDLDKGDLCSDSYPDTACRRFQQCSFAIEVVRPSIMGPEAGAAVQAVDEDLLKQRSEVLGFQAQFRAVRIVCYVVAYSFARLHLRLHMIPI